MGYVLIALFFALPIVAIVYAVISVVQLVKCWKDEQKRKKQLAKAILSTVVTLVLVGMIVWFVVALMVGIANM